jgi:type I restriction enzyme S subunit
MSNNKLIPELRFPEFKNEGEWEEKAFEQLFEIGNGRDYKHLDKGDIPVYGSGGYMLSVNDFLYEGESVCIGRKGTIDKPMFLKGKFWTVDTLFYTHSFKNCLPKYIFYVFDNINWRNHNEAGGVPSLSKTNIYKIKVIVPPNNKVEEQQKIATCLSSLDEVIAAHSQKLELLKDHKKGLMQNLFPTNSITNGESITNYESSITDEDNQFVIRNSQTRNLPKVRFKEFEKDGEWVEIELSDLCFNISSGKDKNSENGAFELYGSTGIIGKTDSASYIGDYILVARVGANAGLLNRAKGIFGVTDNTLVLDLKKNDSTDFIQYTLEKIRLNKLVFGSGQPLITGGQLKSLLLLIPNSEEEQKKIASCLSCLDALITAQAEKIEQLKLHKKGLMQGLFPKINE